MFKVMMLSLTMFIFSACFDGRTEMIHTLQNSKNLQISFTKAKKSGFDIKIENKPKVLVLNFFTTSCGACKEEFPSLNKISEQYSEDVKILGILGEKITKQYGKDFIKKYNINYDVVFNANEVRLFSNAVGDVFGIPVTYIFDKNGHLKYKFLGYVPHNTLKKAILQTI